MANVDIDKNAEDIKLVDYFTSEQLLVLLEDVCDDTNQNYSSVLYNISKAFNIDTNDRTTSLDSLLCKVECEDLYKAIFEYNEQIGKDLINLMLESTL